MQRLPPEIKPLSIWSYVASLALWLSFCIGVAATVIALDIRDAERDLSQYGDAYSDHLNQAMVSSENILKGFSALFGAVGRAEPERAARYVRQVIESNPQIFALELVQSVKKSQLAEFVAGKRREGLPDFSVKSFSYDSDRKWQPLKEKSVYYPIVFMEPMPPGSEDVLGLDVESVPFLRRAMAESLQRHAPAASHPFKLVEGNLAYVVFYPITPPPRRNDLPLAQATQDYLMVALVIDAAKLVNPVKLPVFHGGTVMVYHTDFRHDDPAGQLLSISGEARSPIEAAIFPAFVYRRPLAPMGEPFALRVERQVGWSDLNLGLLALLGGLTLMSSMMLVAYLRTHQQGRILQIENQKWLWQLANHDGLTGLPNRMLLIDRMEQSLAKMRRQGGHLAVMFLDLDDFKQVNDTYGHELGDRVLVGVAERLRAAVRVEDTVARMSGDEFIVLVEGPKTLEAVNAMGQNIRRKLAEGFLVEDQLIRLRTSTGIAMFPEDGSTPEALIKKADIQMYADKQARTARRHEGQEG
jgi:diguanylate cyclase (GGDEF)-like protein